MREIEILVKLHTDIETAKNSLSQFEFIGSKKTLDVYYYDPLRQNLQFIDNKLLECFRIRTKGNKHFITHKIDIYDGEIWKYSEETETEVLDLVALKSILTNLGFIELVTIDNLKHIYKTNIFEVVLEDVKDLGYFLEVEHSGDDYTKSVDEIKNEIYSFIHSLNFKIGEELNSGKPELLLLKKQSNNTQN